MNNKIRHGVKLTNYQKKNDRKNRKIQFLLNY